MELSNVANRLKKSSLKLKRVARACYSNRDIIYLAAKNNNGDYILCTWQEKE